MLLFNIDRVKSVLVLMPDKHMGNLVVSLSAIKALRDLFRDRQLCLVVDSAYSEVADTLGWADKVVLYPRKSLKKSPLPEKISILFDIFRQLRQASPDLSVDLDGRQVSAILTLLSGASYRIGKATADMPYFYNRKVNVSAGMHKGHTYLEIAASLGADIENIECGLTIPAGKMQSMKKKLFSEGVSADKPVVCIHPGAGKIYKQWTSEGFAAVSDWLISSGYQVVFVGTGNDVKKADEIIKNMTNRAYSLADKLSIGELMGLISISRLFIGNDSGPMHLADKIGTPVIALFGPADDDRWRPLSRNSLVLRGEEPCADCRDRHCEYNYKCITSLSPSAVISAAGKILQDRNIAK